MHNRIICTAVLSALAVSLMTSCTSVGTNVNPSISENVTTDSLYQNGEDNSGRSFFSSWDGSVITEETAAENEMVFMNASEESDQSWEDFYQAVKNLKKAEITVCSESKITHIESAPSDDGMNLNIDIAESDDGVLKLMSKTVSSEGIYSFDDKDKLIYYAGEYPVYETENRGEKLESLPFEKAVYSCDPDANMTFPYQKTFSDYADFKNYYLQCNKELSIRELMLDMENFDEQGGFNTHVVFLRGEISGYESIEYDVIRAIKRNNSLDIYVAKRIPESRRGAVTKRQIVVTVPSEFLDEISPKNINWFVYTDEQKD